MAVTYMLQWSPRYIVAFLMIWYLNERVVLLPPKMGQLQFGSYVKSGKFLLSCYSYPSFWKTNLIMRSCDSLLEAKSAVLSIFVFFFSFHFLSKSWTCFSYKGSYRWLCSWKDSCCADDDDTGDLNGSSPRFCSYGCTSDMHASMAGCISSYRCTCCIWSGKTKFACKKNYILSGQHLA